ncbi:MAG TPA: hypothetical protein VGB52_04035 [Actinomycetota bacterium]|jgi:peroxiredoxin
MMSFELVLLESEIEQLNALGPEPAGVSVDSGGRNAAMVHRWHLTFPIASDPAASVRRELCDHMRGTDYD